MNVRPRDIRIEFLRAAGRSMLNESRVPVLLGFHKPPRNIEQDGASLRDRSHPRRLVERVRHIYERLFRRTAYGIQRRNYLNTKKAQKRGEIVAIDGKAFRLLANGHRLFLFVNGRQLSFVLTPVESASPDHRESAQ